MLIGDRSPKCFKVVSLKAGQVRQFTCARSRTKVGIVLVIASDISLFAAVRLKSMPPTDGGVSLRVVSLVGVVGSFDLAGDLDHSTYNL